VSAAPAAAVERSAPGYPTAEIVAAVAAPAPSARMDTGHLQAPTVPRAAATGVMLTGRTVTAVDNPRLQPAARRVGSIPRPLGGPSGGG
jgi:hypothetical protein